MLASKSILRRSISRKLNLVKRAIRIQSFKRRFETLDEQVMMLQKLLRTQRCNSQCRARCQRILTNCTIARIYWYQWRLIEHRHRRGGSILIGKREDGRLHCYHCRRWHQKLPSYIHSGSNIYFRRTFHHDISDRVCHGMIRICLASIKIIDVLGLIVVIVAEASRSFADQPTENTRRS